jgi:hypothetical protein
MRLQGWLRESPASQRSASRAAWPHILADIAEHALGFWSAIRPPPPPVSLNAFGASVALSPGFVQDFSLATEQWLWLRFRFLFAFWCSL